jgi:hypothetical protein
MTTLRDQFAQTLAAFAPRQGGGRSRLACYAAVPDNPAKSCCNQADCYPTEIKYVGSSIYARRREDGKYILIPPWKVERNRDNPDGRNHLCAPPPNGYHPDDTVFCFSLGGGI